MKKRIWYLVLLGSIAMIILFLLLFDDSITYVEGAYTGGSTSSHAQIIKDKDTLEDYIGGRSISNEMKEKLLAYDNEYFEKNMLIILCQWEDSGMNEIKVQSVEVKGEEIKVILKRKTPFDRSDDMKNWGIIIELEKTYAQNVTVEVEE